MARRGGRGQTSDLPVGPATPPALLIAADELVCPLASNVALVGLNYDAIGETQVADQEWTARPVGYRAYERTVRIGHGDNDWNRLAGTLMRWGVKTRSGFEVRPEHGMDLDAHESTDYLLVARIGPVRVIEPVRVIAVVDTSTRRGFAYGTRHGHPVAGEEAFIASRTSDGTVWLTLRSLTRASPNAWRFLFPLLLIAQRWYRARYLRALAP